MEAPTPTRLPSLVAGPRRDAGPTSSVRTSEAIEWRRRVSVVQFLPFDNREAPPPFPLHRALDGKDGSAPQRRTSAMPRRLLLGSATHDRRGDMRRPCYGRLSRCVTAFSAGWAAAAREAHRFERRRRGGSRQRHGHRHCAICRDGAPHLQSCPLPRRPHCGRRDHGACCVVWLPLGVATAAAHHPRRRRGWLAHGAGATGPTSLPRVPSLATARHVLSCAATLSTSATDTAPFSGKSAAAAARRRRRIPGCARGSSQPPPPHCCRRWRPRRRWRRAAAAARVA